MVTVLGMVIVLIWWWWWGLGGVLDDVKPEDNIWLTFLMCEVSIPSKGCPYSRGTFSFAVIFYGSPNFVYYFKTSQVKHEPNVICYRQRNRHPYHFSN